MTLIKALKEFKKLTGITIKDLAEEIQIHRGTLYQYMKGSQIPYLTKQGLVSYLKDKYGITIIDDENEINRLILESTKIYEAIKNEGFEKYKPAIKNLNETIDKKIQELEDAIKSEELSDEERKLLMSYIEKLMIKRLIIIPLK